MKCTSSLQSGKPLINRGCPGGLCILVQNKVRFSLHCSKRISIGDGHFFVVITTANHAGWFIPKVEWCWARLIHSTLRFQQSIEKMFDARVMFGHEFFSALPAFFLPATNGSNVSCLPNSGNQNWLSCLNWLSKSNGSKFCPQRQSKLHHAMWHEIKWCSNYPTASSLFFDIFDISIVFHYSIFIFHDHPFWDMQEATYLCQFSSCRIHPLSIAM